jgi:mRNA interferase MazF
MKMSLEIFNCWNIRKKLTHLIGARPHFCVGEIWWAQLGINIGTEVLGKGKDYLRPVLIIQKAYGIACVVIPLTSKKRNGDYYHSFIDSKGNYQCVLLPQVRYLDSKRLKYQQSIALDKDFKKIVCSFIQFIKNNPALYSRGLCKAEEQCN